MPVPFTEQRPFLTAPFTQQRQRHPISQPLPPSQTQSGNPLHTHPPLHLHIALLRRQAQWQLDITHAHYKMEIIRIRHAEVRDIVSPGSAARLPRPGPAARVIDSEAGESG
ncbi:MAG: hypothetical protein Q9218_001768, partial [Villophora microphyllina]